MPAKSNNALKKRIHPNTLNFYSIPENAGIQSYSPSEYLSSKRLDVVIRYIYAKAKVDGQFNNWAKEAYADLIKSQSRNFTKGACDPGRNTLDQYFQQFDSLIESMKSNGYQSLTSVIPTCKNTIVDGAHRLACALALNIDQIDTIELEGLPQIISDADMKKWGVSPAVINEAKRQYIHLKPQTRCAVLFPISEKAHKKYIQSLSKNFEIDFIQNIPVTFNGINRLQHMLYGHHEWWSEKNAHDFAKKRYTSRSMITFIFYQEIHDIRPVKDKIRLFHEAQNHGLHTTDTHEETIQLGDIAFNENALFWLNNALTKQTPNFDKLLLEYKKLSPETANTCIDTGGVMAAFGLRDAKDLDYIAWDNKSLQKTEEDIALHKEEYEKIGLSSNEIISNPAHHFYYHGIKCVSLNTVAKLKKHRNTSKDLNDLSMINYLKNKNNLVWPIIWDRIKHKIGYTLYLTYHKSFDSAVLMLKKLLPEAYFKKIRSLYHKVKS
jgi:hypothetical protein